MTTITITTDIDIDDEFLSDVFITALEGGINYWAWVDEYQHSGDTPHANIMDGEDDAKPYTVTPHTVLLGIAAILSARAPYYNPNAPDPAQRTQCGDMKYLTKGLADTVRSAVIEQDAGEIDASAADCIVQAALFGEIRYG